MNKQDLATAFEIAKSDEVLEDELLDIFVGCGLKDFKPVYCTLRGVAKLIRYQCQYLFGGWDMEEFQNIARIGRYKFHIISRG